jgi:DNA-binding LacI/PurR family transcriptional regulator
MGFITQPKPQSVVNKYFFIYSHKKSKSYRFNSKMKKNNPTIYDIAKALDVSASTVSRALRDHQDISESVTEKVKKMAKKMNYKANITAQNLKERKTKVIGVIIPEILHHFNMSVLNGIEEVAFRKGFHILIAKTNESYQREIMHVDSLVGQVDGLLVCLSQETKNFDHFKVLKQHEIPLVFFERVAEKVAGHKVVMNDEAIAFTETEHLIKSGYKRIGIITGGDHLNVSRNRINGYKGALLKYNIALDDNLIVTSGMSYQEGRVGFQKLMSLNQKPDSIFATSDQITLAVCSEAKRMGLNLGGNFGLAAFSCDPLLALLEPSVTGLGQKGFEMGTMAAQMCIKEIEDKNYKFKPRTETLSNELIIRKSSQKLELGQKNKVETNQYLGQKSIDDSLIYIY